jgi:hypothetical protein
MLFEDQPRFAHVRLTRVLRELKDASAQITRAAQPALGFPVVT